MKIKLLILATAIILSACSRVVSPSPTNAGSSSPSDWSGIPIMPGAVAGEGDEDGYVYTVMATIEQVRVFYETELPRLGWEAMSVEDDSTLLYVKNDRSESLTINLIMKDDQVLVLLSKY